MRWIAFLLLPAVLLLAAACGDEEGESTPTATTVAVQPTDTLPPPATNTPVPPPEPTDTPPRPPTDTPVPRATSLAEQVAAKCLESAAEVQSMAARAVEFIEQDFGRRVSTDTVLRELDQSTSGMTNVQCSEHLAVLIVLIGQG